MCNIFVGDLLNLFDYWEIIDQNWVKNLVIGIELFKNKLKKLSKLHFLDKNIF